MDNQNLGVVFGYTLGAQRFSAGYMHLLGDIAQPYRGRSEPSPVVEGAMATDFLNAKERTWQVRYDYDFVAQGVAGLTGTLWHMRGNDAELHESMGGKDRSERETQAAMTYTVQSGLRKDVAVGCAMPGIALPSGRRPRSVTTTTSGATCTTPGSFGNQSDVVPRAFLEGSREPAGLNIGV